MTIVKKSFTRSEATAKTRLVTSKKALIFLAFAMALALAGVGFNLHLSKSVPLNADRSSISERVSVNTEPEGFKALRGNVNTEPEEGSTGKALGDGCYHVFLDVGSNVGMHGRFVLEPTKFPPITKGPGWAVQAHIQMMKIFDDNFGKNRGVTMNVTTGLQGNTNSNGNVCVFAFEPNPENRARQLELEHAYRKVGLRYHAISAGVSDQDGNITFYHQDRGQNNEWGFSSFKIYKDESTAAANNVTEVQVPVIRLSKWLRENIYNRSIPKMKYAPEIEPKVLMKMDVEGMEYILLPDLMVSGILCQTVDGITMEWHPRGYPVPADKETRRGGLSFNDKKSADGFGDNLLKAFHSLRNDDCKTKEILLLDDEKYHMDGIPLPH